MNFAENLRKELAEWNKLEDSGGAEGASYYYYNKKTMPEPKDVEEPEDLQESAEDDKDFRKEIQGSRNARNLSKARFYADLPKNKIKKDRTDLYKTIKGEL